MPSLQRCTMVFQSPGHGWTETFYYTAAGDDLTTPQTAWVLNAGRRAALLGSSAYIKALRFAIVINAAGQVTKNRSVLRKVKISPNLQQVDNTLAAPGTCAVATFYNADQSRHKLTYLRGIPDDIENNDGTYNPAGAGGWGNRFDNWVELMRINATTIANVGWWGFVPFPPITLVGYTVNATTSVVTVTLPAGALAAYTAGQRIAVRFRGVNVHSVLNGQQVITVVDDHTARLTKPLAAGPYMGVGEMILYTRTSVPIASASVPFIGSRKLGAPLLVSHGRSPAHQRT